MKLNVKTMAMGMAAAMIRVDRNFLRKKSRTRTAMRPPIIPEMARLLRLLRMSTDWSR
jgi:hypothetical protein